MQKVLFAVAALAAVALSGCADSGPSGEFNGGSLAFAPTGAASMDAVAANNPYPYAGNPVEDTIPIEGTLGCTPDVIVGQIPAPLNQPTCTDAFTWINATNVELPMQDGYMLYLNGTGGNFHVGPFAGSNGTYAVSQAFDEDFTGLYNEAHIQFGDLVIATASLPNGNFDVGPDVQGAQIDAEFSGKTLTYTVSGLSPLGSFEGWLVAPDESGALQHLDKWSITNGESEFEADMNIGDYTELHIHVAGTSINVLKISIPQS